MRIDLTSVRAGSRTGPRLKARGRRIAGWMWAPLLIALGVLLPLAAADLVDDFMHQRGYRDGTPRLRAFGAWAASLPQVEAADLPLLQLDLKFKRWQRLLDKRAGALKAGRLSVTKADFVSGTIRTGGAGVPVLVRLQGSDVRRLRGEKWPLRVRARRGGHVLGIERFTLRSPEDDGVLTKAALYEHMRLAGVAAPRHRYVRLSINGTSRGVMAMEEYFSNELLVGQRRPEGPVLRFGKALLHASESLAADSDDAEPDAMGLGALDNYRLAPVRVFRLNRLLRDPPMRAMVARAVSLLDGFVSGRLGTEEVFDVRAMGRFLAVCEVWGAAELLAWPNLRLYYNPISDRLEPIAYSSTTVGLRRSFALARQRPFTRDLLGSATMRAAYVRAVLEVARGVSGGDVLRRLEAETTRSRRLIASEYPMASMDLAVLAARARALLAAEARQSVVLLARRRAARVDGVEELRLANPLLVDVQVLSARWRIPTFDAKDEGGKGKGSGRARERDRPRKRPPEGPPRHAPVRWTEPVPLPFVLTSTALNGPPRWRVLHLRRPAGVGEEAEIELQARVLGSRRARTTLSVPELVVPPAAVTAGAGGSALGEVVEGRGGARIIALGPGVHPVSTLTRLPPGVGLHLQAGATLSFAPGAGLLLRGELVAEGTEERPVTLRFDPEPTGRPSSPSPSGALVVVGEAVVRLRHLRVEGPEGPRAAGRRGAGAVVMYGVSLHAQDCTFSGGTAAAALRIVRGEAALRRLRFDRSAGDGLSLEYARADLRGGRFAGVGGDAVDLAGSRLVARDLQITAAGDKGISAGERSTLRVDGLVVRGASMGVAVKDSSRAEIGGGSIRATHAGVAAYTKKRRFGPAEVEVTNLQVRGASVPFLAQGGSTIRVDGKRVPASTVTVRDLLGAPGCPKGRQCPEKAP